jgi:peroxiredoxin Q/BCP
LAEKFPNDVVLLGASADTQAKQQEFITKHMLPFALLCDTELKLIQALGIQMPGGKPVPQRMTFVVAPDGKIAKIYTKVTPKAHPEEVRTFVAEIRKP